MFVVLLAALLGAPRVEAAAAGGHRVVLSAPMREAVRRFDPTFRVWRDRDFPPLLVQFFHYSDASAPFAAIGDFNGDGKRDAVLCGRTARRAMFLAVVSHGKRYRAVQVSDSQPEPPPPEFVFGDPRERGIGVFLSGVSKRGTRVEPLGDVKPFVLRNDAFEIEYWQKAAELYYMKNGRFHSVITAD